MNIEDIENQLADLQQKLTELKSADENIVLKGRIQFCASLLRLLAMDVDKSYNIIKAQLKLIQSKLDEFCPIEVENEDDEEIG